jgi:transcriptional regulator
VTLYLPAAFRAADDSAALDLLRAYPFATLLTLAADEVFVSHLPLLPGSESEPVLRGHLAAANPHAAALTSAPSVAIFLGPHAYVSPRWYADPAPAVPTWNYAAVHVHGQARRLDAAATLTVVDELTAHFEADSPSPWRRGLEGDALDSKLRAIVGFELPATRIEAKFKMSQNRSVEDRAGVIAGLSAQGGAEAAAVAAWMRTQGIVHVGV